MFKRITAICLTFILVMSMAIIPVFASGDQSSITTEKQSNVIRYDKKDKIDENDAKKLIENIFKKFSDSDEFDWAQKSIEKMGYMGILSGTGNGYFKPKNNVTHAEAIAMVLKLTGDQKNAEAITEEPLYFKGNSDKWSYGYLQLALDKGIIIPSEDGKFNPRTPAKRHEIAKYVVRALGKRSLALQNMNTKLDYKDATSIPKGSVGYVYVITNLEIMQGSNNQFKANEPITRAELAVILDKAEGNVVEPGNPATPNQGLFVSYDNVNNKLTLNIGGNNVIYNVLPNVPVYKNATYYGIASLIAGDVIKVIVDSQNQIIFIEFKQDATIPTTGKLVTETVAYENLPQILKDKVDVLKLTQSFTSFKYNNSVYLIATRGAVPTGGFSIGIKDVYKEVNASKFDLKVVVEMANPAVDAVVTQVISYPYNIVKLNYFNGIDKVNFVNTSDTLLAQTVVNTLDVTETINGKIDSVDVTNRIVKVLESDNIVRSYSIPTGVLVTIDNVAVRLSSLTKDMPIVITKTDGIITKLAATNLSIETISGKIDSVDAANRIVRVLESDNVARNYLIPTNVNITLNNQAVYFNALLKDMTIVITRTNGIITRLAATNVPETVNGKISSIDAANRIVILLESDNAVKSYFIPTNVVVTLNNRTVSLSSLMKDMPVVLTKVNGEITKLAATNIIETINGKIDSVVPTTRIVTILESDNIVRTYYIPSNVIIMINNRTAAITDLNKDMPVVLTRTNGVISKLAATNTVETISGRIDSVDVAGKIVKLLESNNVVNSYTIPVGAQITLDNITTDLSSLLNGMKAVITKSNGFITKLAVQRDIQSIEGILVTTYTSEGKKYISVKVGTAMKAYEITANTAVYYNNVVSTIESIPLNSTLIIKIENSVVVEVRNK